MQKAGLLFPDEELHEIMLILDDYGHDTYQQVAPRIQMAVLRMCNGKVNRLRAYMDTARGDFRDVLAVAEYPRQFRNGMIDSEAKTSEADAATKDYEAYQSWLKADSEPERGFVCENCSGVGIIPDKEASPRIDADIRLPQWVVCPVCSGTGQYAAE